LNFKIMSLNKFIVANEVPKKTVYTALTGNNSQLFPKILQIYVKPGATIADVTYGNGVFWKQVDTSQYNCLFSDISGGTDLRKLPYENSSIDALILDPPYMPTNHTGVQSFEDYYQIKSKVTTKKWMAGVMELYFAGIKEAERALKPDGILIIKCQDTVCANKQVIVHNEIINFCAKWFKCEDLFVLVQQNKRPHPQKFQVHARKNHSYFLVFTRNEYFFNGIREEE